MQNSMLHSFNSSKSISKKNNVKSRFTFLLDKLSVDEFRIIFSFVDYFFKVSIAEALSKLDKDVWQAIPNVIVRHMEQLEEIGSEFSVEIKIANFQDADCSKLSKLRSLDLKSCRQLTDEGLKKLNPNMEKISVATLKKITNVGCLQFQRTNYLDISHCPKITKDLFSSFGNLKCLNLSSCLQVNKRFLNALPKNIEELNLSNCRNLNDDAMKELKEFKWLKSLNVGFLSITTTESFLHVKECIKFHHNLELPNEEIEAILNLISDLEIRCCPKITDKCLLVGSKTITSLTLENMKLGNGNLKSLEKLTKLKLHRCDYSCLSLPLSVKAVEIAQCKGILLCDSSIVREY